MKELCSKPSIKSGPPVVSSVYRKPTLIKKIRSDVSGITEKPPKQPISDVRVNKNHVFENMFGFSAHLFSF
jgi:hypothetical protein